MKANPRIVITGANGFIGSCLVEHFAGKGWNVVGLVREMKKSSQPNVSYVAYSLGDPVDDSIFGETDYFIHAAYIKQGPSQSAASVHVANVHGAEILLEAARKHRVKLSVFISSLSSKENAASTYGQQKYAIEKLFADTHGAIVRPGLVIGNGGLLQQILQFMRSKHLVPLIDGGKQPLQIIAIYDLVSGIEKIVTGLQRSTFNIAYPTPYIYKNIYETIGRSLKVKFIFIPIPSALLLHFMRLAGKLHINLPLKEDNLLGLTGAEIWPVADDLKQLGLQPDSLQLILDKMGQDI